MIQFYKPWEMLPEEETKIEEQIREAQALIDRELAGAEQQREVPEKSTKDDIPVTDKTSEKNDVEMETVGDDSNKDQPSDMHGSATNDPDPNGASTEEATKEEAVDNGKDPGHDGEEVNEGEDTVIY